MLDSLLPQDSSLFWMTWMTFGLEQMDVVPASQPSGIFFHSTSGIWSQGPNSDLFLEFFHFSNLKFLYSRKILTIMCHHSHCLVLQLPFCLLETQRDSWAVNPLAFSPPSCSPPLAAVFWFTAQTLCCHTFNDLGPQSLPFSCPCPFICSSSKVQPWFHFCSAYPEALRVNQHFQAVWSAFCVALASPVSYPIARVVFSNLYHFPQLWSLPLWSSTLKRLS